MNKSTPIADVCLILEGAYPYVTGGVSTWTHDLIRAQSHMTFHLVTVLAPDQPLQCKYDIPANVLSRTDLVLHRLPEGQLPRNGAELLARIREPILRLQNGGSLSEVREIVQVLRPHRQMLGRGLLLNSIEAWRLLEGAYRSRYPNCSFLDYFWSWRALLGGLFSVLLCELPAARVYHTICTGYAGLLAARAKLETGRPVLLTEHGIYTNERRVEIGLADWLHDDHGFDLSSAARGRPTLKNLWVDTFAGYSRACYEASDQIITLYEGNRKLQILDGALPERTMILPNGIEISPDAGAPEKAATQTHRPTVAFIGRVVPIKDVKTFIRAAGILRNMAPEVEILIMGPTDEDPDYFEECKAMIGYLGLEDTIRFTGRVRPSDYFPRVDAIALTSISEAQPLVILEAGAAGIPCVATDVGACREMILGSDSESPPLGPGGAVTPLCNPAATARELARLLNEPEWRRRCGTAIGERVRTCYDKRVLDTRYRRLYEHYRAEQGAA